MRANFPFSRYFKEGSGILPRRIHSYVIPKRHSKDCASEDLPVCRSSAQSIEPCLEQIQPCVRRSRLSGIEFFLVCPMIIRNNIMQHKQLLSSVINDRFYFDAFRYLSKRFCKLSGRRTLMRLPLTFVY